PDAAARLPPEGTPFPQWGTDSARTGPLQAGSLTPEPSQSQPPTAEWYAGGAATLDHETHSANVDGSANNAPRGAGDRENIQTLLNTLVTSEGITLHPNASTSAIHVGTPLSAPHVEYEAQPITASAQVIARPPREGTLSTHPHPLPAEYLSRPSREVASAQGHPHSAEYYSQAQTSSDESEADSTNVLTKTDATRRMYVTATSNFDALALDTMREFKVVATISDNHVNLSIAKEKLAQLTEGDGSGRARLLDLAEDMLITRCGSPPQTVRIEEMTLAIKKLFTQKPKKNLVKSSPSPSAVVEKSPTAVMLTDFLATTCASSLRSGEMIDVVSVSSLDVSPIDVTFVVHGMTGRKLRQRADCLKRIVRDCLTNVYELGSTELEGEIGVSAVAFAELASLNGLYVISRSLNVNDDIGTAWVGGPRQALEELRMDAHVVRPE
ncbi:Hypothetical protein, putative, partial [Bodo saltans]